MGALGVWMSYLTFQFKSYSSSYHTALNWQSLCSHRLGTTQRLNTNQQQTDLVGQQTDPRALQQTGEDAKANLYSNPPRTSGLGWWPPASWIFLPTSISEPTRESQSKHTRCLLLAGQPAASSGQRAPAGAGLSLLRFSLQSAPPGDLCPTLAMVLTPLLQQTLSQQPVSSHFWVVFMYSHNSNAQQHNT